MDRAKTPVCFVGWDRQVCDDIVKQLRLFFGDHIEPVGWVLTESSEPPPGECDIYIASVNRSESYIRRVLPRDKKVIVAQRALNPRKITNLLQLEDEKRILAVAASENGAAMTIQLLRNLGIEGIDMRPYYPGCREAVWKNATAVITGQDINLPPGVAKVVDLGTKGLDISTLAELAELVPGIPKTVLNLVAQGYIRELFAMGTEQHRTAKRHLAMQEATRSVLNTMADAVIALDETHRITLLNRQAEAVLGASAEIAVGRAIAEMIPEPRIDEWIRGWAPGDHRVVEIDGDSFALSATGIANGAGMDHGAVIVLREVRVLLEMEEKIRNNLHKRGHYAKCTFKDILGDSPALLTAKELAKKFAGTDLPVLLQGETGTGKDLFAQSIHNASSRRRQPYVAVNFAALAEGLVESELFGHVEGAFTGAKKGGRAGLFEQAHKGTIFLDEIGEASPDIQKKLLRVLENKEIRRVGGDQVVTVDVRVVAATNRDLQEMMREGGFRSDLFYRLGALSLNIPSLAERRADIFALFQHFHGKASASRVRLARDLEEFLGEYHWPGNVRELQNTAMYLASVRNGGAADCSMLPRYMILARERFHGDPDDGIGGELRKNGCGEVALGILRRLAEAGANGKPAGRGMLLDSLRAEGMDCTEHDVKKALILLNALGLCKSGATRRGTRITGDGMKYAGTMESSRGFLSAR